MAEEYGVRHHFVVNEVIAGRDHCAAVERHQLAKRGGVVDFQCLERRLFFVDFRRFGQFQPENRAGIG